MSLYNLLKAIAVALLAIQSNAQNANTLTETKSLSTGKLSGRSATLSTSTLVSETHSASTLLPVRTTSKSHSETHSASTLLPVRTTSKSHTDFMTYSARNSGAMGTEQDTLVVEPSLCTAMNKYEQRTTANKVTINPSAISIERRLYVTGTNGIKALIGKTSTIFGDCSSEPCVISGIPGDQAITISTPLDQDAAASYRVTDTASVPSCSFHTIGTLDPITRRPDETSRNTR